MGSSVEENISIKDALINVSVLDDLTGLDNQPCIEGFSLTLDSRADFDTNFEDCKAFVTSCSKYIEEATRHAEFSDMLREGFCHAADLYTWRCCSRAVPMPKSNDQPNRTEINEKIVQVLEPHVRKLNSFMRFTVNAIDQFCKEFRRLCHPEKRKEFISEAYLIILGKFLNMFVVLDALKDMKASIKNDLSTFHRASQQPSHNLILFLATQNRIKQILREELQKIEAYEELLADIININVYFYENKMYISPAEKHTNIKVTAFCLYLMDFEVYQKLDQKKRISINKLDKIFKSVEVVPLFGDMNVLPFSFVKQCRNAQHCATLSHQCKCYDPTKWPLSNAESDRCHVDVVNRLKSLREQHVEYVAHLAKIKNELSVYDRDGPRTDAENSEIANVALSGLQFLSNWTSHVIETVAWKLLNPTNTRKNPNCPENAETYELATKYNYQAEEKSALIEIISMVKGVQQSIGKMKGEFGMAIRSHIYVQLQDFIHVTLRDTLNKAMKHKKDLLVGIITSIIETGADSLLNTPFDQLSKYNSRSSDLSIKSSKKSKKTASSNAGSLTDIRVMKQRSVAPSNTQLYIIRTMLESLLWEKTGPYGKKILRKDIDQKHLDKILRFLEQSYFWPALLNFSHSLDDSTDLSQLWFREFYLEMSMGSRIQFPIDMSFPWILIDHILTCLDPALTECILYQLDLYNDAADYALRHFKKQFLYDEVEAEVNLCFDQFIFKLSEAVFTHYKQLASSMLLDKEFKAECSKLGITIRTPPAARFHTLLQQRHIQLLGRSIDLNRLVTQRVNAAFLRSLDIALCKFESEGLHYIIALDYLISINNLCHQLLSEHLSLISFSDLFAEANRQVSEQNGRITLHIFSELVGDLIPNFCFNTTTRRFVRGKHLSAKNPERHKAPNVTFTYEFGSKSLNAAFSNLSAMYNGFIGIPHLKVVAKFIGYQGISAILNDLITLAKKVISEPIKTHTSALFGRAPRQCKLPRYDYGMTGVLQYYIHHNREFTTYVPIKEEFCQALREFGNIVCFALLLELAVAQEEMLDLLLAVPFTGVIPKPSAANLEEQETKMQRLENKYSRIHISNLAQQLENEIESRIAHDNDLFTRERLCCGLNIFEMMLTKLFEYLNGDQIWRGPTPTNGVMWVDECLEWHRIWSGFQFVYCMTQAKHTMTVTTASSVDTTSDGLTPGIEEIFGDGVLWAGCTMIRVLQQHRRFEVLDYSYHILRVYKTVGGIVDKDKDQKDDGTKIVGVPPVLLIDKMRRIQASNNQIFIILGNYSQQLDKKHEEQNTRYFSPPVYQSRR